MTQRSSIGFILREARYAGKHFPRSDALEYLSVKLENVSDDDIRSVSQDLRKCVLNNPFSEPTNLEALLLLECVLADRAEEI